MQPEQQQHGDCGQAKGAEIDRRSVRQQDPREAGVHPSHLREHHMRGKPDGKVGHHADHAALTNASAVLARTAAAPRD